MKEIPIRSEDEISGYEGHYTTADDAGTNMKEIKVSREEIPEDHQYSKCRDQSGKR